MNRIALCALFCLMVSACVKQPGKLSFMVGGAPNEMAYWEEIVADFEKKHGTDVEIIRSATQTEQRKQAMLIALRGRKADPDVMLMDVAWVGQMAASNWLEPLPPLGLDPAPFYRRVINQADTWNDRVIGLPVYVDGGLLYYRKDLLDTYGYDAPPRTWEELIAMSQKIQTAERAANPDFCGFVWQGAQYEGLICTALEFFVSAGGGFLTRDGASMLDSEANQTALQCMVDLIHKYNVSPPNTYTDMKEEEVRHVFQQGNALFERNWPYAWGLHQQDGSAVKGKTALAPLPHFEGETSAATLGGWHVALSKFSDRKEQAAQFIKYITSYGIQKKLALKLGWNPGRRDVYDDEELVAGNPQLPALKPVFENAVSRPAVPYYSQLSLAMQKHFNAALAGTISPKAALAKAHAEVRSIIADNTQ
ncbi:MAG: extracellular solute-binding protein [Chitinivibrionales bacterium]|nr:extracellular solute-binding protein [Chitinivibrionales bacterium]